MKKVKFNVVNLSEQKITRNEMKNVSGGETSETWCLCVISTQYGYSAICLQPDQQNVCATYGSIVNFDCDPYAEHNGVGCNY